MLKGDGQDAIVQLESFGTLLADSLQGRNYRGQSNQTVRLKPGKNGLTFQYPVTHIFKNGKDEF